MIVCFHNRHGATVHAFFLGLDSVFVLYVGRSCRGAIGCGRKILASLG
jgi:hypothetical protein